MRREEFDKEIAALEAVYFSGRSEAQLKKLREVWFKTFSVVARLDFLRAIEQYQGGEEGQKEPRPAGIFWLAHEAKKVRLLAERPVMVIKFGPLEHECCPRVDQVREAILAHREAQSAAGGHRRRGSELARISEARALLAFAEPGRYEAIHVECPADTARCPFCGHEFTRLSNPFIVWLKHKYPQETAKWVPYFKGTVVCDGCSAALKNGARIAVSDGMQPVAESTPKQAPDYKVKA